MASIRIIKYARPYLGLILVAIVLLFAQANFDLALPNYLSDIVNTGIQQGGVEDVIPVAIRETEMNRVLIFVDHPYNTTILDSYTLVTNRSSDYHRYVSSYPMLENQSVYILNHNISPSTRSELEPIMARALVTTQAIELYVSNPSSIPQSGSNLNFNIPQGMDVFVALSLLPEQNLTVIKESIVSQFDVLGENMITQSAIVAVRAEYIEIGMDMNAIQNNYIFRTGFFMLIVTFLSVSCTIIVTYLSAKTAAGMARDIRRKVFYKVETFSPGEFDKFSTASLISRSTNDITQIQMVIMLIIRMAFYAPIIGIGGIILAIHKGPSISWIIALAVGALLLLVFTLMFLALPKFKIIQKLVDRLNLVSRENLSGMMVIRAFNKEKFEEERFDKANKDLTSTTLYINRLMAIMMPIMLLIMNGVSILIIWEGSHQVADLNMQVGDMIAFMQYTMQIVMSFLFMSMMLIILPRGSVSADRILQVLDTDPAIKDPLEPKTFSKSFSGRIEFRDVSFKYHNAENNVLTNISFTAKPGQTTAIIGATGAGKSTIINLIPRFYDVTSGSILVDGIDIRDVTQHDLHEKIGLISQKSVLFSGSIESNLRFGDQNASIENLKVAISIAQAEDFVTKKPEGLRTTISQGGSNVSGGQKQRLSIARALVKRPPIYLFDDSFSALDFKTDSELRKALKANIDANSTILIVTQRASTIRYAEQIIVLDEGQILDKGTHEELMQRCETYKEIVVSQIEQEDVN